MHIYSAHTHIYIYIYTMHIYSAHIYIYTVYRSKNSHEWGGKTKSPHLLNTVKCVKPKPKPKKKQEISIHE